MRQFCKLHWEEISFVGCIMYKLHRVFMVQILRKLDSTYKLLGTIGGKGGRLYCCY